MAPAHADRKRIGPNWQAVMIPTATPLPVIVSTSRMRATVVSQLPEFEISWPMKNSLKLRFLKEIKVTLNARLKRGARGLPCISRLTQSLQLEYSQLKISR